MGFIAVKCPQCGADVQLDDSREFGFCNYCGTKIVQEKTIIEHHVTVKYDNDEFIEGLYKLGRRSLNDKNYDTAHDCYKQILQNDPNSWEAAFFNTYTTLLKTTLDQLPEKTTQLRLCLDSVFKLILNSEGPKDIPVKVVTCYTNVYPDFVYYNLYDLRVSHSDLFRNAMIACAELYYQLGNCLQLVMPSLSETIWKNGIANDIMAGENANRKMRIDLDARTETYANKIRKYKPDYKYLRIGTGMVNTANISNRVKPSMRHVQINEDLTEVKIIK